MEKDNATGGYRIRRAQTGDKNPPKSLHNRKNTEPLEGDPRKASTNSGSTSVKPFRTDPYVPCGMRFSRRLRNLVTSDEELEDDDEEEAQKESSKLVPLLLTNHHNVHRFKLNSVERTLQEIANEQGIEDVIILMGQESKQLGPFWIKVSAELAQELIELEEIDILETQKGQEEDIAIPFKVERIDELGRKLSLYEELVAKQARHAKMVSNRRQESDQSKEESTPSTLAIVSWPFETVGKERDQATISKVTDQIRSSLDSIQKGAEEELLFTYTIIPVARTELGAPTNRSLVFIDFPEGKREEIAASVKWPKAIPVPGVVVPLRFAFKSKFIKENGLKPCCNRQSCYRTTAGGTCKLHFAFKLPDFVLPASERATDSGASRRNKYDARIEARQERKRQAIEASKEMDELRASKRAARPCRFHKIGKCRSVVSGCEYNHEGKDPADIFCHSAGGGTCKIENCPYKGHVEAQKA